MLQEAELSGQADSENNLGGSSETMYFIGLVLGLAFALGLTRLIARLLYGIGANDPVTVVSVVMLLGAMSLAACYLPAHRAMRRNPVTAIREL